MVYIVFDNDELDISGVFDTEIKAVEFIEELMADDGTRIELDVCEKQMYGESEWAQAFMRGEYDTRFTLYALEVK